MSYGNNAFNEDLYYMGQGSVFFELLDENDQVVGDPINVGSCNTADVSLEVESQEIRETQSGQNNVMDRITRSKTGTLNLSIKNFDPSALKFGLYAEELKRAGETAKNIVKTAKPGGTVLIDDFLKTVDSVTLSDGTTILTEGVHYVVSDSSIYFPKNQDIDGLQAEDDVTIVCSTYAVRSLQALVKNSVYVRVTYTGVNTAKSDAPLRCRAHKLALDPMQQRALISIENEAEAGVQGTMLASRAVTGNDRSKVYEEETIDYDAEAA